MKRKSLVLLLAAFLVLALVAVGCGGGQNGDANGGDAGEIKIGTVGPLSGGAASYGVSVRRGVEVAVQEVNDAGGIDGMQIVLISEDTGGDSTEAANAISKLIDQDMVSAIIGAVLSSETLAGAAIAEDAGVVLLSPTSTATGIPQEGEYIFRNCLSDDVQAAQLAEFANSELGLSRFAVMYANNDYGVALKNAFIETASSLGEVVAETSFMDGDDDFSSALTRIAGEDPDALFIGGYYEEAAKIAQQARERGLDVQILGADGFYSPILVELGGSAIEGAIFTAAFYEGDDTPDVVEFVSKYQEANGDAPDMFAAQGYDAARLVLEAIKDAGNDKAGIRDSLAQIRNFAGVTGNTSFDDDGDVLKDVLILQVEGGTFDRIR